LTHCSWPPHLPALHRGLFDQLAIGRSDFWIGIPILTPLMGPDNAVICWNRPMPWRVCGPTGDRCHPQPFGGQGHPAKARAALIIPPRAPRPQAGYARFSNNAPAHLFWTFLRKSPIGDDTKMTIALIYRPISSNSTCTRAAPRRTHSKRCVI